MANPPARRSLGLLVTLAATAWSASAAPSGGCGHSLASGVRQLVDQGITRVYRLSVPASYRPDVPHPLVLLFHGWGGDENEFLGESKVTTLADERGYILVAPRGLGSSTPDANRNSWSFRGSTTGVASGQAICASERTPDYTYPSCRDLSRSTCSWTHCQADDVAFTLALIRDLESKLCIDSGRIFAAGGSNGGMFTWELGQNAASATAFTALAPLIGLPHRGFPDPPAREDGLPVLLITGSADRTVPPGSWESPAATTSSDGDAYFYTSATAMMRRCGAVNHCPYRGRPATPFAAGAEVSAECRTYCEGDAKGWSEPTSHGGWPRVLDCRAPMGHEYGLHWSWPLILKFFDAHSKRSPRRPPALE